MFMRKIRRRAAVLLTTLAVLPAVAAADKDALPVSRQRQKLIDFGMELRGTPYQYGGKTASGFDCSGFVSYVANNAADTRLSPHAASMYKQLEHIGSDEREPGDLIFFAVKNSDGSYRIQHVGIYLGLYTGANEHYNGKRLFLHAASDGPRTGVIVSSIDEGYWEDHFYGYARFLPSTMEAAN